MHRTCVAPSALYYHHHQNATEQLCLCLQDPRAAFCATTYLASTYSAEPSLRLSSTETGDLPYI